MIDQLEMFAVDGDEEAPVLSEAVEAGVLSYQLDDEAFRAHCVRLGVLYQFAKPGARAWEYLHNLDLSEADWLDDEGVRYAQEHNGARHRYTDEQMRSHWACVEIQRQKIQAAWGVYGKGRDSARSLPPRFGSSGEGGGPPEGSCIKTTPNHL